ncbi:MAG: hypothetical protein IJP32_11130 [Clostridia bacterium]|nr:hypothetical protein [Clostridia bacterium]MBQ9996917.1 hypothetical protein [Clostridia bacterium]
MKIVIRESGEWPIKIVLPTRLIFNPLTAKAVTPLINKALAGKLSEADEDIAEAEKLAETAEEHPVENCGIRTSDMVRFCHEINRMKRLHGNLPLIEIVEGNDCVKIYL